MRSVAKFSIRRTVSRGRSPFYSKSGGEKNLKDYKNILITSKKNPDIDGYACMVAYRQVLNHHGIKSFPVVFGKLQQEARYIMSFWLRLCRESTIECNSSGLDQNHAHFKKDSRRVPKLGTYENDTNFDAIILVDTSMRSVLDPKIDPQKVVQIIDHHKDPELEYFPNSEFIYEPIGSLATRFVEMFQKEKIDLDKNTAILLYAAILSNTINLKNFVTTKRDHQAINYLEKIVGIPKDKFAHEMFSAKSKLIKKHLAKTTLPEQKNPDA